MPMNSDDIRNERIAGYAAAALLLDLQYTASSAFKGLDMESISIILCVTRNTLYDLINEPNVTALHIGSPSLPDAVRRGMSRRAIADKLDFSRETVRRRTKYLIEAGILDEDDHKFVRISQTRICESGDAMLNAFHECVMAYLGLLGRHKVGMPLQFEEQQAPLLLARAR